ncbi:hypothetical protein R1flu_018457 [Riccia fluitans]|uniref:LAGLIDADG homing endonuclease n=1 Tax=Riccia fluitans TaxID=41844 RepID=A0ABD1ZJU5_9MARC
MPPGRKPSYGLNDPALVLNPELRWIRNLCHHYGIELRTVSSNRLAKGCLTSNSRRIYVWHFVLSLEDLGFTGKVVSYYLRTPDGSLFGQSVKAIMEEKELERKLCVLEPLLKLRASWIQQQLQQPPLTTISSWNIPEAIFKRCD